MKVLFVSESQGWSGGAAQLLDLALGLKKLGWDVKLATPQDGEVARRAVHLKLPHIPFHPRKDYDLPSALRLAELLCSQGIEILHAHHPRAHAVGLGAMYLSRCRPIFVVTRRVSFALPRNPFTRLKYRNPRIDGYIAVAESIRQELLRAGVSPDKVRTIPSGVDAERFKPRDKNEALVRELGLTPGVPVIVKVGNYGEWKGQDIFLDAMARLMRKGLRTISLLIGRDTNSPALRRRAQVLGLEERDVRFLGFRTDVPELLSLCDISVNAATQGEGISGAIREALSMRIPVVASDAGGNCELVQDGVTGKLFKAGDAEDLARVLAQVLEDPDQARRLAEAGQRLVRERYSVEAMVQATAAYYQELVARRSAPNQQLLQEAV